MAENKERYRERARVAFKKVYPEDDVVVLEVCTIANKAGCVLKAQYSDGIFYHHVDPDQRSVGNGCRTLMLALK